MDKILYFPFVPFGDWLRQLSLSGSSGNMAAIALYVLVSLIPFLIFLALKSRKKAVGADRLLPVMTVYLFFMIYFIINPYDFGMNLEEAWKVCLNITFISLLIAYLVFRALDACRNGNIAGLQTWLIRIVWLAVVCYVISIIYNLGTIPASITAVAEANTELDNSSLTLTYVFIVLRQLVNLVPDVFSIAVCYAGIKLLKAMQEESYGEAAVRASEKLDSLCRISLIAIVSLELVFNLLQILLCSCLRTVNTDARIPVTEILIAFAVMLINKYLRLSKELKEENDAFI